MTTQRAMLPSLLGKLEDVIRGLTTWKAILDPFVRRAAGTSIQPVPMVRLATPGGTAATGYTFQTPSGAAYSQIIVIGNGNAWLLPSSATATYDYTMNPRAGTIFLTPGGAAAQSVESYAAQVWCITVPA